jgi:hypothetical protein
MSKKKSNGYGRGTFVETSMFLSPAWMSLGVKGSSPTVSGHSIKVLVMFLGKRRFADGKDRKGRRIKIRVDENRFTMSYNELAELGMTQPAATRCFDELLAKGFITVVHLGGAREKDQSIYGLSDKWQFWKVGNPPIEVRKKDSVRRGFQRKKAHKLVDKKQSNAAVIPFPEKQNSHTSTLHTHAYVNVAQDD